MDAAGERGRVNATTGATSDASWMRQALALAARAGKAGEVPVGAVVVKNNHCIAEGWNQTIALKDPSAHAEIVALRAAARYLGNHRLLDTTLYVTLEPCAMCAGAIVQARVSRVVYAAADPKAGAAGSVFNVLQCEQLNHQVELTAGVLREEAGALLQDFFKARR